MAMGIPAFAFAPKPAMAEENEHVDVEMEDDYAIV
jgi:hypothetical protein